MRMPSCQYTPIFFFFVGKRNIEILVENAIGDNKPWRQRPSPPLAIDDDDDTDDDHDDEATKRWKIMLCMQRINAKCLAILLPTDILIVECWAFNVQELSVWLDRYDSNAYKMPCYYYVVKCMDVCWEWAEKPNSQTAEQRNSETAQQAATAPALAPAIATATFRWECSRQPNNILRVILHKMYIVEKKIVIVHLNTLWEFQLSYTGVSQAVPMLFRLCLDIAYKMVQHVFHHTSKSSRFSTFLIVVVVLRSQPHPPHSFLPSFTSLSLSSSIVIVVNSKLSDNIFTGNFSDWQATELITKRCVFVRTGKEVIDGVGTRMGVWGRFCQRWNFDFPNLDDSIRMYCVEYFEYFFFLLFSSSFLLQRLLSTLLRRLLFTQYSDQGEKLIGFIHWTLEWGRQFETLPTGFSSRFQTWLIDFIVVPFCLCVYLRFIVFSTNKKKKKKRK